MAKLFSGIMQVITIIIALVQIVERPGEGKEKRQEVISLFLEEGNKHLTGLPTWAAELFMRESFIGWLVDLVVWMANRFGFFASSEAGGTA